VNIDAVVFDCDGPDLTAWMASCTTMGGQPNP
jgi:hypothetical protein